MSAHTVRMANDMPLRMQISSSDQTLGNGAPIPTSVKVLRGGFALPVKPSGILESDRRTIGRGWIDPKEFAGF